MNPTAFQIGFLSILLAPAMISCAGDPFSPENGREKVPFTVSESTFPLRDTIVVTLSNRSDRDAGYNLCFAELDRRTASGWRSVQRHPPDTACPDVLNTLAPGESARLTQTVREEFPAGVYRFRVEIEWPLGDRRFTVFTGSFRIEELTSSPSI